MDTINSSENQQIELDGKRLFYSFLAGAQKIFENQQDLNKLNVFPVPDADTGTNLASTMRSIVENIKPSNHIKNTAVDMADAALIGARGNSGIIFAQFIYGFSNELKHESSVTLQAFAEALNNAVEYAYQAISEPVEGTIITVMKAWAEFLESYKEKTFDFGELMRLGLEKAQIALENTKQQLEVLKNADVVDSGAKGFVFFLEGVLDFFYKGNLKDIIASKELIIEEEPHDFHPDEITHRYCTEALIEFNESSDGNRKTLSSIADRYGDSIVIAGSKKKMRLHIHTNKPADLFVEVGELGDMLQQKVDDMQWQANIAHNRKANIALLTDSVCDIPEELLEEYQIHTVPLSLFFGNNHFIDNKTIKPDRFYELLESSDHIPSTSQPTVKEFRNTYSYLSTHYDSIIAVHVSKAMSGTWSNSEKSAKKVLAEFDGKIDVIDSKQISISIGLLVLRIAEAIKNGMSHDEIVEKAEEWRDKSNMVAGLQTLKYFIRGGRVSPMKGRLAQLLNMKPVLGVDENGKATNLGVSFKRKSSFPKALKMAKEMMKEKEIWGYSVAYSNKEEKENAEKYAEELSQYMGTPPLFVGRVSPVIGVSAGFGTLAVGFMYK